MSPEEFEAIQAYVDDVAPLAGEQAELAAALDPDASFDFAHLASRDIEQYREAVQRQHALWDRLAGMQAPLRMTESHQLRILAAKQIYEAATTMIGEIESGRYYSTDSDLMSAGRSQFEAGLGTWADAEFGIMLWHQLIDGAYFE
jgi:hypothetical protein